MANKPQWWIIYALLEEEYRYGLGYFQMDKCFYLEIVNLMVSSLVHNIIKPRAMNQSPTDTQQVHVWYSPARTICNVLVWGNRVRLDPVEMW